MTSRETPDVAELRRLLDAYLTARGLAPIIDAWYAVARAALAALPALLDATAERDALAAQVAEVREWIDRRGVNVGDRDDDYMRGYRDAQRHAVQDAAELRATLDGAES